ncbi:redoxin family protein [Terriglobus roseus]|uniref:Thiol-disulfide isomerase or thioredoxin n=1 Tax=Terriglobus roseus TaxID=392734 RepID=A0A1H4JY53_9BACT|nr:redoxin family protein [Terriglobus roseus]SEB51224.1 Thiol-disulfide isomerase or thioredoxin [Terriglobus roseus]
MCRIFLRVFLALLLLSGTRALPGSDAWGQLPAGPLPIGSPLPDFQLTGTDGAVHKPSEWKSSRILVVAFLCNHCTESQVYEARLNRLAQSYGSKGVSVVAIQSSNPKAVTEKDLAWSDVSESLDDMKERATFRKFQFPYLYDGDTSSTAHAFGATVAPSVFIFDGERKLRYAGQIDSDPAEGKATVHSAMDAVEALVANKPVAFATTTAAGCKLLFRPAAGQPSTDAQPVSVTLATTETLSALRKNPTGKLLLVNFYATWCGPCVTEFPDLMATNRMYRDRPFAFTTVSSNVPDEKNEVLAFLQKMHASTSNLLYGSDDTYAMQEAFDPNVGSAVPVTVLLSPRGDVLFHEQGEIDLMEIRRAILAHLPDDAEHAGSQKYWASK